MKRLLLLALGLALPLVAMAQRTYPEAPRSLQGQHTLMLKSGLTTWSTDTGVTVGSVSADSRASGFVGSMAYTYGATPDVAVGLMVGVLDVGGTSLISLSTLFAETALVMPVLVTVAYYPEALALGPAVRPFVGVAGGPYLGEASRSRVGFGVSSTTVRETAFGARMTAGADLFLGRRFKLSAEGGYHLVSDFGQPIGGEVNYSGPEFSFGFGFIFGRTRR